MTGTAPPQPDRAPALHDDLRTLREAGRNVPHVFTLPLPDGSTLECVRNLRILPGKRLAVEAHWHNASRSHSTHVVAKLFFDSKNFSRDIAGYQMLSEAGIPTAEMLHFVPADHGGVSIYENLAGIETLDVVWADCTNPQQQRDCLQPLLQLFARLYRHNLVQTDPHPGNFVSRHGMLFALDVTSCIREHDVRAQRENLALLLAQFPLLDWPLVAREIAQVLGDWHADADLLQTHAMHYWQQRKKAYLKKMMRDCSEVADISIDEVRTGQLQDQRTHILCRREYLTPAVELALRHPQPALQNAKVLKAGNSATVGIIELGEHTFVFKQYRDKDIWRKLRRALRPSRAKRSWYFAHLLQFCGIRTPGPVAVIEEKGLFFLRSALYMAELAEGETLLKHWETHTPTAAELEAIEQLFTLMDLAHISHGDMKASNLICTDDGFSLLDLDGMREIRSRHALSRALTRDWQRFRANWPQLDALLQKHSWLNKRSH